MELTTKGRYAVTAMAAIASQGDSNAIPLSQVAESQVLPLSYLEQIFVSLRRAGLVESARGRSGGYRLARSAAEISIADIMAAVAEDTDFTRCADQNAPCRGDARCLTHRLWTQLSRVTGAFFTSVSLADVVSGALRVSNTAFPEAANRVYLDHNASEPLRPAAKLAMIAALDIVGNSSSVHGEGRLARGMMEAAREKVAALVNAKPSEIVFSSGATEANNWVMAQPFDTIFVAGIEHDSILAAARANGARLIMLPVNGYGRLELDDFARLIRAQGALGRAVVSVQLANNETGVIQDVAAIASLAHEHDILVHTDAAQAPGRIPVDFAGLGVDLLSISAHKLGGPKGAGALVIRDRLDLVPLLLGGGQERRRRAGTENLPSIASFGAAAEEAAASLKGAARIAELRDALAAELIALTPGAVAIATAAPRLPNTLAIAVPGMRAETLVIRFDLAGIAISAGSACSSGKVGASHVLEAMGLPREIAEGAIRISLGAATTAKDIAIFKAAWKAIAGRDAIAA